MKARDVMTTDVGYCQPNTTLANAAMIMWQRDCGAVPVVNEHKQVVGMITDRDVCIALAMQNRLASQVEVREIISGKVTSCKAGDDLENVIKIMRRHQLRRLPVIAKNRVLVGVVSISDLLNAGKGKEIKKKLFAALRKISSLRPIHLHEIAADSETRAKSDSDSDHAESTDAEDKAQEQNNLQELIIAPETEDNETDAGVAADQ